jgi:G3E family GTPase
LRDTVRKYRPQRVLIEPSGVAEVATLLGVLQRPDVADLVHRLKVLTLIDACAFLRDYARMPDYFEAQTAVSPVLIINKTDLVDAPTLRLIGYTLQPLAPSARVLHARFGAVDREALAEALRAGEASGAAEGSQASTAAQQRTQAAGLEPASRLGQLSTRLPRPATDHEHHHDHRHASVEPATVTASGAASPELGKPGHEHARHHDHKHGDEHAHEHGHEHAHHGVELGYVTWSGTFEGQASLADLETLLQRARSGGFGSLRRAKGIVSVGDGWVRFDLAGARVHIAAHVPAPAERSRATAIGESIDAPALDRAFEELMQTTMERVATRVASAPLLAT